MRWAVTPLDEGFPRCLGLRRLAYWPAILLQLQKWFALRFTGPDTEIDPLTPRNGQPPEFDQWRWERLDRAASLVVPFRREVYQSVAQQFAKFAVPAR